MLDSRKMLSYCVEATSKWIRKICSGEYIYGKTVYNWRAISEMNHANVFQQASIMYSIFSHELYIYINIYIYIYIKEHKPNKLRGI
jgi:hypothetical protein